MRPGQNTGKAGENAACNELLRLGYAVIARGYRTRFGEIDIICEHEGAVVFVEVKARRSARFGEAAEAMTPWKRRRIAAMALDYLAWVGRLNDPCRFDVVAIDGIGTTSMRLRVIRDAFHVSG